MKCTPRARIKKIGGLNLEGKVVSAPPRRARSRIFLRKFLLGGPRWEGRSG